MVERKRRHCRTNSIRSRNRLQNKSTAQDIMFVLEGLRVCSQTMGLSESRVDRELLYIMEGLVYEDL